MMGISSSCLPVSLKTFPYTLRSLKSKTDIQEEFNYQKNAVNLNQASEDELLLLPGITRSLAGEIVHYRSIHHGFKQIDDLVNVNGMTLEIFKQIYSDIIVDSNVSSDRKQELVNLNFASFRELCSIPGLTPDLVKRIIQRRERKGSFRFIEDLLKIKGMNYIILASVRPHVTVHQPRIPIPTSVSDYALNAHRSVSYRTNATDTLSLASILLETLPLELQTMLVSSPPQRLSTMIEVKEKIFRFASWNLQELSEEKVQNPGVREVICRVILENK